MKKVGDKYVIEIETVYNAYASVEGTDISKVPGELYRIKGFNNFVFDQNELNKLEKYNSNFSKADLEKARQEGREEAWEAAKKIVLSSEYGGIPTGEFQSIFGNEAYVSNVFMKISVNEAIEKIKSHEEQQKADGDINVGDEVICDEGIKAVVLDFMDDNERIMVYSENGIAEDWWIKEVHKTGRHFSQLQEMFDQMQEE